MKKLILIIAIMLGFVINSSAQVNYFTAYELAVKIDGKWSAWEDTNIRIKIDINNDRIVIYSNRTQIYDIISETTPPYDSSGSQKAFKFIDQDDDIGTLRLRVQNNGAKQIYIDFNDISWVYNIE